MENTYESMCRKVVKLVALAKEDLISTIRGYTCHFIIHQTGYF